MGNRSYLAIKDTLQLFEANNTFPVFWLLGFDRAVLEDLQQQLQQLQSLLIDHYEETEAYEIYLQQQVDTHCLGYVSQPLSTYAEKLHEQFPYIEHVYPETKELYQSFMAIVDKEHKLLPDAVVEVHFLEYLGFYNNYQQFYDEWQQLVNALETNEKLKWLYDGDVVGSTLGSDLYSNHHSTTLLTKEVHEALHRQFMNENRKKNAVAKSKQKSSFFHRLFGK